MFRLRNFAARSPLLRKGGMHKESKSNQRTQSRHALNAQILNWENERYDFDENDATQDENESL